QAENSFFFELRIAEQEYDTGDPEGKTKFHREIARKLCTFQEEVERDNYLEAVAERYHIGFDNLRKLVLSYATQTGLARPVERPRSGVATRTTPADNIRKSQRLLLTWIAEEPAIYPQLKGTLTAADFTEELYCKVAERMFAGLETGTFNPAALISIFADEEEQRQVAAVFNTRLPELSTRPEREKAIHDILITVKKNSYEYFSARLGSDVNALAQVIAGKKALEELAKTHISLD
ncbi:MAG: DNA primase, partial [Lachnospiraceae bacterium]|nr:DNA primase [Lachnospiraceae bacterium]